MASALMAKMKIAPNHRPKVRLECVRLLATLQLNKAKAALLLGFLDTYLRLTRSEQIAYEAAVEKRSPADKEKMMEVT